MNDSSPPTATPRSWALDLCFAGAVLLGAFLLFQIQPMAGKRIVPWFGGGPAVWTAAVLFFQTALLAGYAYAHASRRLLRPGPQVAVHAALLAAAVAILYFNPVVPTDAWKPAGSNFPVLRVVALLSACVGAPYLMLAATAPLVQAWFSGAHPGRSPYRLYALSNFGSLAALLAYPLVVEPRWGVARQGVAWSAAFVAFAILCTISGVLSLRGRRADDELPNVAPETLGARSRADVFFWIALPACASALMLAATNVLCQDVASLPLLWVAPLGVYLATFILCFDSDRWYRRWVFMPGLAATSFAARYVLLKGALMALHWQLAGHLALLFVAGMVCHGELAKRRPAATRLTSYYLCIAAGGALGGLLVGVAAPWLLPDFFELQIGIVAAWLLALGVLVTDKQSPFYDGGAFRWLLGILVLLVALAALMYTDAADLRTSMVASARNFYGTLKVREFTDPQTGGVYFSLANGRISHGAQFRDPANRRVPTQYYHGTTGIGQIMRVRPAGKPLRVGCVGLGTGTVAAFADKDDRFTFFDINPEVIEFADKYFTFLDDARDRGAVVDVVEGDARLALERASPYQFDRLVLDAFSGDSIPTHLLTLEAFELYLKHLADPGGVLIVHVSNLHLDLGGVVKAAAEKFGLDAAIVVTPPGEAPLGQGSTWILLSREHGVFAKDQIGVALQQHAPESPSVTWTDDFTNIWDILR